MSFSVPSSTRKRRAARVEDARLLAGSAGVHEVIVDLRDRIRHLPLHAARPDLGQVVPVVAGRPEADVANARANVGGSERHVRERDRRDVAEPAVQPCKARGRRAFLPRCNFGCFTTVSTAMWSNHPRSRTLEPWRTQIRRGRAMAGGEHHPRRNERARTHGHSRRFHVDRDDGGVVRVIRPADDRLRGGRRIASSAAAADAENYSHVEEGRLHASGSSSGRAALRSCARSPAAARPTHACGPRRPRSSAAETRW